MVDGEKRKRRSSSPARTIWYAKYRSIRFARRFNR